MEQYAFRRISELERAINKLKISAALVSPSSYTIEWIRDNLEADASFYSWIVTALETDVAFYNWFRDALEADASFISSLISSFEGDLGFNNWILTTATYSSESFITLTRTTTQTFTGGAVVTMQWQSVLRNSDNGTQFQSPFDFTPPNTTITIPQSGYYNISFSGYADVVSTKRFFLIVNGVVSVLNTNDNQASSRYLFFNITNYFDTGDTFAINLQSSVTIILSVTAEKAQQQSPILHVVRVNAAG
jgi:hypothetical protein